MEKLWRNYHGMLENTNLMLVFSAGLVYVLDAVGIMLRPTMF